MNATKRIALVAHDDREADPMAWASRNHRSLLTHDLVCTGTTGLGIGRALEEQIAGGSASLGPPRKVGIESGPLGGDPRPGARIADGNRAGRVAPDGG